MSLRNCQERELLLSSLILNTSNRELTGVGVIVRKRMVSLLSRLSLLKPVMMLELSACGI
jgi:hypothetical protein